MKIAKTQFNKYQRFKITHNTTQIAAPSLCVQLKLNFTAKYINLLQSSVSMCAVKNETVANIDNPLKFALLCPTSSTDYWNLSFQSLIFKIPLKLWYTQYVQLILKLTANFTNSCFHCSRFKETPQSVVYSLCAGKFEINSKIDIFTLKFKLQVCS